MNIYCDFEFPYELELILPNEGLIIDKTEKSNEKQRETDVKIN